MAEEESQVPVAIIPARRLARWISSMVSQACLFELQPGSPTIVLASILPLVGQL
jgi:hypothetical protein